MPDPKENANALTPAAVEGATLLSTEKLVASLAELKVAVPDADALFYVSCLEKDMTVAQAKDAWMDLLTAQNQAQAKEIELNKARKETPGVEGLNHTAGATGNSDAIGGDAVEQFNCAVRAKMAQGTTRERAVAAVTNENPGLHKEFLLETNPGKRHRRLIEERFDEE